MGWQLQVRSFRVIAPAALLLAAVFGFMLGSMGGGVAVVPAGPELEQDSTASRPQPRTNTASETPPIRQVDPPPRREPPPRRDPTPDRPDPPPVVGPRKLAEGRIDQIEKGPDVAPASAEIEVTLKDEHGRMMPFAQVALDIASGPLGWQTLSTAPEQVRGQRGQFKFKALHPGEYRVRSTAANYVPAERVLTIHNGSTIEQVELQLAALSICVVEFHPRYADGVTPQDVMVQFNQDQGVDDSKGRFGSHRESIVNDPRGRIAPTTTRIRVGQDGSVKMSLNQGVPVALTFTAVRDGKALTGSVNVTPEGVAMRVDVTLDTPGAADNPLAQGGLGENVSITLLLSVNGSTEHAITRVSLRARPEDFAYRQPNSSAGHRFQFDNIARGKWYVVAEARDVHAAHVQQIDVMDAGDYRVDIQTGRLRVNAAREVGSPDPSGDLLYTVRLRPQGSGTIERTYNGNLKGKQTDYIDFIVPTGPYEVLVGSPEQSAPLVSEPAMHSFTMAQGGNVTLDYVLRASCRLTFRCVTSNGAPVPNAEFLVTFHPAGSVPESEKSRVLKGGSDGLCVVTNAPYGPAYLMIWSASTDWANPDRVHRIELPAFGTHDLGNIVVGP